MSDPQERRLGTRYHVDPLPVVWMRAGEVPQQRRRLLKKQPAEGPPEHPGVLVNVSVTGAGVVCGTEGGPFAKREPLAIVIDGNTCRAEARWERSITRDEMAALFPNPHVVADTLPEGELRLIGVEFAMENHAFEILMDRLISAFRPNSVRSHRHQWVDASDPLAMD